MPKRMLAGCGQKLEPKNTDDVFTDPPKNFDFDFCNGEAVFAQPPAREQRQPGTHGANHTKHKRQCTTPEPRPSTHDEPKSAVDKRLHLTKVEDNWIGVAFGSPTHPLSGWTEDSSPVSAHQPLRLDGQLHHQTPSKWKKIGGIFRAKSPPQLQPTQNPVHDDFDPEQHKLGIPLRRVPWRNPRSPPAIPIIERKSLDIIAPPVVESNNIPVEFQRHTSSSPQELPKLEIEIPSTEMERYSIMFRHINGISSPSLCATQSRTTANPTALQARDDHELPPLPVSIPPRLTTNTPTRIPYSLFPTPPKTKVFDYLPSTRAVEALVHVRSASAPATLSPCHDTLKTGRPCEAEHKNVIQDVSKMNTRRASITEGEILQPRTYEANKPKGVSVRPKLTVRTDDTKPDVSVKVSMVSQQAPKAAHLTTLANDILASDLDQVDCDKPLPLRPRRGPKNEVPTSPEDDMAISDKEDTPWESRESPKSSASSQTSIEDEIFFDIKSFRGSKDQGVSQFVISRPDSTAVQHARSMSRKVKFQQYEQLPFCLDAETQAESFCMPPDIQAAEHFCITSESKAADQNVRLSMFDEAIAEVERLALPAEAVSPLTEYERSLSNTMTHQRPVKPTISIPTRQQGCSIAVPSPIPERSEENTPTSTLGKSPAHRIRHIASQASYNASDSPQSFTSSIWDVPPPVPEKDTKYLPISKYAAHRQPTKGTLHRSHNPSRSVIENPVYAYQNSSTQPPARSASFSTRTATGKDGGKLPARRPSEQNVVAVTVRPAAECSVARTVSLRRKTSHQVLVSRSSSRRSDQQQQSNNEEKVRWSTEQRALSPVVVLEVPKGHKPGASVNLVVENI